MTAYDALASRYDALTGDVQYEKRADFIEKLFRRSRIPVHTVLDLACGTGTMTWILTARGYELIAVDNSEDMLAAAMRKSGAVEGISPIFLHQSMPKLDLYGTVDAAVCVPILWTCSACRATAHGTGSWRSTGSGPIPWRS